MVECPGGIEWLSLIGARVEGDEWDHHAPVSLNAEPSRVSQILEILDEPRVMLSIPKHWRLQLSKLLHPDSEEATSEH